MGKPVDREALLAPLPNGRSLGRPSVAKALVKAGHVADIRQAFDQLIGEGKPAFIPRRGPCPADVIGIINRAGGIASLAHPGLLKRDDLIPGMIDAGLTAVEAFHSEHDATTTRALSGVRRASRHPGVGRLRLPRRKGAAESRIWDRRAAAGPLRTAQGSRDKGELMAAALLTGIFASVAGIAAAIYLGLTWTSNGTLGQHISIGIFSTMITLFTHSMMMFYFLGKGKAVREAAAEGGLSREFERRIAIARKPVFSIATLAMVATIITALAGASVDTGVLPSGVHGVLAYSCLALNLGALRVEINALTESGRVVEEVNQLLQ